jgi:hypothetical protein
MKERKEQRKKQNKTETREGKKTVISIIGMRPLKFFNIWNKSLVHWG